MVSGIFVFMLTMNKFRVIINLAYSLLILFSLIGGLLTGNLFNNVIISLWIFLVMLNFNWAENWNSLYFKTRDLMFRFKGSSDIFLKELMESEEQIVGLLGEIEDKRIRTRELLYNLKAQGYLKC
jgi:hypothetical protein